MRKSTFPVPKSGRCLTIFISRGTARFPSPCPRTVSRICSSVTRGSLVTAINLSPFVASDFARTATAAFGPNFEMRRAQRFLGGGEADHFAADFGEAFQAAEDETEILLRPSLPMSPVSYQPPRA